MPDAPATTTGETTAFVISVTPFDSDGRLDEPALREHLNRMAAADIGVYVAGGGSGEAYTLSEAERRRVMEIGVDELKGRVPIRAMGVEPRTAQEMIEFARTAGRCGVDATQIYSLDVGHGEQPTEDEIDTYFSDILEAVDLPCVISTHRSVGYVVPVPALASLVARFGQVQEINCTRDELYFDALLEALRGRAGVFVGGELMAPTALAMGASGYLSSVGNLAPKTVMSVVRHYNDGDLQGAATAYAKVMRLARTVYTRGGIRMTKALLQHFGLPGGYVRKPRLPLATDAVSDVVALVRELGIDRDEGW